MLGLSMPLIQAKVAIMDRCVLCGTAYPSLPYLICPACLSASAADSQPSPPPIVPVPDREDTDDDD